MNDACHRCRCPLAIFNLDAVVMVRLVATHLSPLGWRDRIERAAENRMHDSIARIFSFE